MALRSILIGYSIYIHLWNTHCTAVLAPVNYYCTIIVIMKTKKNVNLLWTLFSCVLCESKKISMLPVSSHPWYIIRKKYSLVLVSLALSVYPARKSFCYDLNIAQLIGTTAAMSEARWVYSVAYCIVPRRESMWSSRSSPQRCFVIVT